ncbi:50S ribosomal protein L11 methyltransferase [Paenibacillus sp. FJAT-26967]|uniref:50S ribosomal protein L11 methyltransferase n=1 Tax=Paenibacillus sp. FJAT-26967 TaxID=1729690 RepID=UPI0008389AC9|nr:50S ribosomal protein L11 methyltransferase [Paenibacillus sp. FJAT-26967]
MRWHEITVYTTEQATEMISNFLHEFGAGGVSIEESGTLNKQRDTSMGQFYEHPLNDIPEGFAEIKGYFLEGSPLEAIMTELKQLVEGLTEFGIDIGTPAYGLREVDEEDWANAWKQYFKPTRITERLTIKPTWEEYEASPEELILELDPGMAFGTGTHATTSLCLKTLEEVIQGGEDVIDVGTGSGILAIAAAKLGARSVLAVDLDPVAVASASENAVLNGLDDRIHVKLSDLLQVFKESEAGHGADLGVTLPVKIVVANILAEVILLFVDDVYKVLTPDGYYVVSGVIQSKEKDVENGLLAAGFEVEAVRRDGEWVAMVARKR